MRDAGFVDRLVVAVRFEAVRRLLSRPGDRVGRRAAVRARRKRRVMKERHHVAIARAVEVLELIGGPGELNGIGRDVRVEREEERIAVTKRVRRVAGEPPRRPFRRNQL